MSLTQPIDLVKKEYQYIRGQNKNFVEFLYNDKPKLFKSPTEGNIIIRIMNVSCSPEQGLNKMIYSFSGTAYEVAESTEENCQKYKLVNMKYGVLTSDYEHIIE